MAPFQLSPGVVVTERDLTNIVPAVATSTGAFAGTFPWGPVLDPLQITSENNLVSRFGIPTTDNAQDFFTAANFLAYSNNLLVCRTATDGQLNAVATPSGGVASIAITTQGTSYTVAPTITVALPDIDGGVRATATAVLGTGGDAGKVVSITIVNPGTGYTSAPTITAGTGTGGSGFVVGAATLGNLTGVVINNEVDYDNEYSEGNGVYGLWAARYPGALGNSITVSMADSGTYALGATLQVDGTDDMVVGKRYVIVSVGTTSDFTDCGAVGDGDNLRGIVGEIFTATDTTAGHTSGTAGTFRDAAWEYAGEFDDVPGTSVYAAGINGANDELHIVVVDSLGRWTGTPGTIIEKFPFCSKASDAKSGDGTSQFYKDVVNNNSKYIYWMDFPVEADLDTSGGAIDPVSNCLWGVGAEAKTFATLLASTPVALAGGVDDLTASTGESLAAWSIFQDVERFDIGLLPLAAANPALANDIIGTVCDTRKDCVAFVSPTLEVEETVAAGIMITGNNILDDTLNYRKVTMNANSSYAVCDSGWKKQYDRYNDLFRWIPINGDIAGLCARTDYTNDPWFSPAGLNRGLIKNTTKLSFNPNKAERDELYKAGVNPVVSFPGQGVLLYGDKTLLAKPSAFDRINVRRLFITLEKAIATAAKYQLFEFNNSFTRAQFKSMVEPFLRDVQGRQGIYDFRVVCDETNNTGEVIDRNEFVGDIYIKPARSINFITLNFIAARTAISFDEIGA